LASGGPLTQEQPNHRTSTSSDAYATHGASPLQNTRDQRLVQLTDELHEHADRLLVQTSLVEQEDAELVNIRGKLDELLLSRRSRDQQVHALEQALQESTSRAAEAEERSRRAHEQIALVEQKDAELVDMRAKLDELLLSGRSRDQHVRALEQALQKATSRVADADERSRLAHERHETELAAVRSRLADAENGWAKSKREADRLRASALTTTDFVSTNEDRTTRESVRRIQAMGTETEWSDKNSVVTLYRNEG
jgi:chromosome segregation ATPase